MSERAAPPNLPLATIGLPRSHSFLNEKTKHAPPSELPSHVPCFHVESRQPQGRSQLAEGALRRLDSGACLTCRLARTKLRDRASNYRCSSACRCTCACVI